VTETETGVRNSLFSQVEEAAEAFYNQVKEILPSAVQSTAVGIEELVSRWDAKLRSLIPVNPGDSTGTTTPPASS
jgi:hypothetical protein